jgi:L-threonylcarbamoyladenylate synthase
MRVSLEQAIVSLKQGEVVAIPTETVYGLAADARNEGALRRIYAVKERPATNPLIVHIADADQVLNWAVAFPPLAQKLAARFWPGPFTMVLAAQNTVSPILTANQPTIALRVPDHPLTLTLLKQSQLGLAAPSANKYTQLSPTTPEHVEHGLGEGIAVLDGGACKVGIESTIIEVYETNNNGWQWQLLRAGMLSEADITNAAEQPQSNKALIKKETTKVPGQHLLHYSPVTPLQGFNDRAELIKAAGALAQAGKTCAALLLAKGEPSILLSEVLPSEPVQYAEKLYSVLHTLDALNVERLLIELPPDEIAWHPIFDRLSRAMH